MNQSDYYAFLDFTIYQNGDFFYESQNQILEKNPIEANWTKYDNDMDNICNIWVNSAS